MSLLESLETIDGVSQAVVNQVQALFDDFVEGRYVFDNNVFFITSHLKSESNYSINSRLFVQMVKGK